MIWYSRLCSFKRISTSPGFSLGTFLRIRMGLFIFNCPGCNQQSCGGMRDTNAGWPVPPLLICRLGREVLAAQKADAGTDLLVAVMFF